MGFYDVRRRVVAYLDAHEFESEARDAMSENNLLATGEISADDVRRLINRCSGTHDVAKPMSEDPGTLKHEMKPVLNGEQWFIRFYFIARPTDVVMFISVHNSKYRH